jgi:hypothetical protein
LGTFADKQNLCQSLPVPETVFDSFGLVSLSVRLIKVPLGNQTRPKPSFPPFYFAAARAGHFGAAGVVRIQKHLFFLKKKRFACPLFILGFL